MDVFLIRNSRRIFDKSLFSGSMLSVVTSGRASFSSISIIFASMVGSQPARISLLTNYQTLLRILSIIVLLWALFNNQKEYERLLCCSTSYALFVSLLSVKSKDLANTVQPNGISGTTFRDPNDYHFCMLFKRRNFSAPINYGILLICGRQSFLRV
jgi:hypothetical protein